MLSLRLARRIALLPFLSCAACSAPSDHPDTPQPQTTTVATATATAPETTTTTAASDTTTQATSTPDPPQAPKSSALKDLTDAPGDARLDAGAALLKSNEPKRAKDAFVKVIPDIDATGTLDAKLAGHALLGRACQLSGDAKCADAHYKTVRELWKSPEESVKALDALGGDEKTLDARKGRALNAVGEALFYAAELKRIEADKEKFPVYKGSGKKDDVLKHVTTKVATWLKARRDRVQDAEKAYVQIVNLQPVPPPRWVIAAGSRVGDMWAKLVTEAHGAPLPKEWTQSGPIPGSPMTWEELRTDYFKTLDEALAPQLQMARSAFTRCKTFSEKFNHSDAFSKRCEEWLLQNPAPASTP